MNKVIKQETLLEIEIKASGGVMSIEDFSGESVEIDKQGARQLIEVLKE